jgi:hypothetical protein
VVQGHEVACDSQHQQSAPGAGRGTKINGSDPLLPTVCTAHPTPPFLTFFHPPIELTGFRPRGRLDLDRQMSVIASNATFGAALEPVKLIECICKGGRDIGSRFAVQRLSGLAGAPAPRSGRAS